MSEKSKNFVKFQAVDPDKVMFTVHATYKRLDKSGPKVESPVKESIIVDGRERLIPKHLQWPATPIWAIDADDPTQKELIDFLKNHIMCENSPNYTFPGARKPQKSMVKYRLYDEIGESKRRIGAMISQVKVIQMLDDVFELSADGELNVKDQERLDTISFGLTKSVLSDNLIKVEKILEQARSNPDNVYKVIGDEKVESEEIFAKARKAGLIENSGRYFGIAGEDRTKVTQSAMKKRIREDDKLRNKLKAALDASD